MQSRGLSMASVRSASHAGSWYPRSEKNLLSQLESFVEDTESTQHNIPGCRVIISPHAGYSYSGPTAAYGFKALDITGIKRIFILGPSHHFYLSGCALSRCSTYTTPLGDFELDTEIIQELSLSGMFDKMEIETDEDEHSIEMQLPFLRMVSPSSQDVRLVPILVGNLNFEAEQKYGEFLSPYLDDKSNAFVISSDFCHWGNRFSYTYYRSPSGQAARHVSTSQLERGFDIWQSIEQLDKEGMRLIEGGSHQQFSEYLARTKNTICGRHPIGVILAAMDQIGCRNHFRFLDYRQSNQVTKIGDGSVSYASGILCP